MMSKLSTHVLIKGPETRNKRILVFILGIFISVVIGFLDRVSGHELSFFLFYLIPIAFVTWYLSGSMGFIITVLCSVIWFEQNILSNPQLAQSSDFVLYWNTFIRISVFIIVVVLLSSLKISYSGLEKQVAARTSELNEEIEKRKLKEEELRIKSEKLSRFAKRTHELLEEQNALTSREIHDELGQLLTAIKIDILWLAKKNATRKILVERLVSISYIVDETIATIRKIAMRLRPRLLDELGFHPAIQWYIKDFQSRTRIKCNIENSVDNISIDNKVSVVLMRILQEAMTNISRHANATRVNINLSLDASRNLIMDVKDNGVGIRNVNSRREEGLGIIGMHERAKTIGGVVFFSRAEGGGTLVNVVVPLKQQNKIKE